MTETLAHGYSSESTQREQSNEYQHDRVCIFSKNLCVLVLWMKVAPALVGLCNFSLGEKCFPHHPSEVKLWYLIFLHSFWVGKSDLMDYNDDFITFAVCSVQLYDWYFQPYLPIEMSHFIDENDAFEALAEYFISLNVRLFRFCLSDINKVYK